MRLPERLKRFPLQTIYPSFLVFLRILLLALWLSPQAFALNEGSPIHYSGDKQLWNRKLNKVELFKNAIVRQPEETLSADYIILDFNARTLDAKGHCIYVTLDSVIYGQEMHFNLDTRTGTIVEGRIANQAFTLAGERINKLGEGRFQTHWGEYSTCHDCAQSWSISARDVDMQIDGYAYMNNVTARIKDAPAFWMPYLIVPMKTKRQSGFLFPTLRVSDPDGFVLVQPYFWAINRSSDMTISPGTYTKRGLRLEWEGRYALGDVGQGKANVYYLKDRSFAQRSNRTAVQLQQFQELPWGFIERLHYIDFSDNKYPLDIGDVYPRDQAIDPFAASELSFSRASEDVNFSIATKRFRNILNITADENKRLDFDPNTVQVLPAVTATTNDHFLFGSSIATGFSLGLTNFTRSAGPFDHDYRNVPYAQQQDPSQPEFPYVGNSNGGQNAVDPLREATRFSALPTLYTTFRPFDRLSLVPSASFPSYFYSFHGVNNVPNLYRGYLHLQLDLTTQFEKVYEWPDDPDVPRTKHSIRPFLSYSNIPAVVEAWPNHEQFPQHPFLEQIHTPGYNFDSNDIVPTGANPNTDKYYYPLGNSLTYGFTTKIIRRQGSIDNPSPTYQRALEFSAGHSINFWELRYGEGDRHEFSRGFANLQIAYDQVSSNTQYYYYPYSPIYHHYLSTDWSYSFVSETHQRLLSFTRAVGLGYTWDQTSCVDEGCEGTSQLRPSLTWSINDYIMPSVVLTYNALTGPGPISNRGIKTAAANLLFQSPSQCWKFTFAMNSVYDSTVQGYLWSPSIDLSLNLTGSGFGGMSEASSAAMAH